MYATSRRCVARMPGRSGAGRGAVSSVSSALQVARFLSSHATSLPAVRPPRLAPRLAPQLAPCQRHLSGALATPEAATTRRSTSTSPSTRPPTTPPTTSTATPVAPASRPAPVPQAPRVQPRKDAVYTGKLDQPSDTIAVLGGGLTGLATAFYLTLALPRARITVYEAGNRLGGWIDTEKANVKTPDGDAVTVHFERAARMVKPLVNAGLTKWDDLVFFELVTKLNLASQLMHSPAEATSNSGFLYYPDYLVALPSPSIFKSIKGPISALQVLKRLFNLLLEPAFRDIFPAIPTMWRNLQRPNHQLAQLAEGRLDMSIGDYFVAKYGCPGMVDKVTSAMIHGITGGDVWKQSMGTSIFADGLVDRPRDLPITKAIARVADVDLMRDILVDRDTHLLAAQHLKSDAVWFRNGFNTLTNALADALRKNPSVTIKMDDPATLVSYDKELDRVKVASKRNKEPSDYTKVISTIPAKILSKITGDCLPTLASSTAVTIMVVNIWYPTPQANFPYNAFGYLLPQALDYSQNPEFVLGVIFDSDREFPLPTPANPVPENRGADTVQGTKLTVMLGGHYWDGLPDEYLPTPEAAIKMAKDAVARHLDLPDDVTRHAHATAKLCRDCIPQHLVGHRDRMRLLHEELAHAYQGRLAVAGQSYQNPGVLPLLRAARDIAQQTAGCLKDDDMSQSSVGDTGLLRFTRKPQFVGVEKRLMPLRFGSEAWVGPDRRFKLPIKPLGQQQPPPSE